MVKSPHRAGASAVAQLVKNPPANAGDARDTSSISGSGRSAGGGNDNSLQYSCLENPTDREAWWATVHGVAKGDMTKTYMHRIHIGQCGQILRKKKILSAFIF